jgi:hypothetical protein
MFDDEGRHNRHPPTYEDVVRKFDLTRLVGGSDIQVQPDGDFALTKDGDFKLGDDKFNALFRLTERWRLNEPTLQVLFASVYDASTTKATFENDLNRVAPRLQIHNATDVLNFHRLNDQVAVHTIGRESYSGTIVVVLQALLRRAWSDLSAKEELWNKSGQLIAGRSFGEIVEASANNFKHNDEWAITNPFCKRQQKSVDVIADVFGLHQVKEKRVLARNVCPEVLDAVCGADFEMLNRRLFEFANDMVDRA